MVEPDGRELLDVPPADADERLLVEAVDPAVLSDEEDAVFVSVDLPAAVDAVDAVEVEDVGGTDAVDEPVVPDGRVEPAPEAPVPERPEEADPLLVEDEAPLLPEDAELAEPLVEAGLELAGDELPEADPDPTFSAVRSIVTGRLPAPDEAPAPEDEPDDEAVLLLPGLSEAPEPLPPDEDVPPEDFLSVAISSPPEPDRSQDIHYTHLFAKRYRCGKDFCALQKNDSPGSG